MTADLLRRAAAHIDQARDRRPAGDGCGPCGAEAFTHCSRDCPSRAARELAQELRAAADDSTQGAHHAVTAAAPSSAEHSEAGGTAVVTGAHELLRRCLHDMHEKRGMYPLEREVHAYLQRVIGYDSTAPGGLHALAAAPAGADQELGGPAAAQEDHWCTGCGGVHAPPDCEPTEPQLRANGGVMEHRGLVRAAPKGTNWWRCPDCLQEGTLGDLVDGTCVSLDKLSPGEALTQAIDGTGRFAPDGKA